MNFNLRFISNLKVSHSARYYSAALVATCILGIATVASAITNIHTEEFSTTIYQNETWTTADWDTQSGLLKLRPFTLSPVGTYDIAGDINDIKISGDIVLLATAHHGMHILDISDPVNPVLLSTYSTEGHVREIVIAGDLAVIAESDLGLIIIDISDPSNPTHVSDINPYMWVSDIAVSGNHVYTTCSDGCQIIDITDVTNPVLISRYGTQDPCREVVVSGNLAFMAIDSSELQVVDFSDPAAPFLIGSCDMTSNSECFAFMGSSIIVAAGYDGLESFDISDPRNPISIGLCELHYTAEDVAVAGNIAYVANDHDGLQMIDISDPTNPIEYYNYNTPETAGAVAISGNLVFLGHRLDDLYIFDISDAVMPAIVGSEEQLTDSRDVVVAGDLVLVADGDNGLQLIDNINPTNPIAIGLCNTPGQAWSVAWEGRFAFVADHTHGLQVIDISDPQQPVISGSLDTPGIAQGIDVDGDFAFIADLGSGLQIIDVSDLCSPQLFGSCDTPGYAHSVEITGDLAFISDDYCGLQIIDISNPAMSTIIGTCDTPGNALDVAVAGDLAFIADSQHGLQVLSITDPAHPVILGSCDTPGNAFRVSLAGDFAFVADADSGLVRIDITDPMDPFLSGVCGTPGSARGLDVEGNFVFVADSDRGLQILQAYQHEVDLTCNIGQSLGFDDGDYKIPHARLISNDWKNVQWNLSTNWGINWTPVHPSGTWARIGTPRWEIVWRAILNWTPLFNPTTTELTVEWLNEFGRINSVTDVPDDQGGWVNLELSRSGYDFEDEIEVPITGYQIYRRVDDVLLQMAVNENGQIPDSYRTTGSTLASFDPESIRLFDNHVYLLAGDPQLPSDMPPGTWEILDWLEAELSDSYEVAIPASGDSTASGGTVWSVIVTTAHTTDPEVWFVSPPDSGYSVDNIAPAAPTGLQIAGQSILIWDEAPEHDFAYFTIYGSENSVFDDTAILIDDSVDPIFAIAGLGYGYLHVTTSDQRPNESAAASIQHLVSSAPGNESLPSRFAFGAPRPNPFQTQASTTFDLPLSANVRLIVVDASGRQVRTLVNGLYQAGHHRVLWDGNNDNGLPMAPGVYFLRIHTGDNIASRRTVKMK
jgi:hypothetical protein